MCRIFILFALLKVWICRHADRQVRRRSGVTRGSACSLATRNIGYTFFFRGSSFSLLIASEARGSSRTQYGENLTLPWRGWLLQTSNKAILISRIFIYTNWRSTSRQFVSSLSAHLLIYGVIFHFYTTNNKPFSTPMWRFGFATIETLGMPTYRHAEIICAEQ